MTNDPQCLRCGRPTPDGYACRPCASELAQSLSTASGHAEDAEAVISRQTRYGAGSRGGSDDPLPGDLAASAKLGPIVATFRHWTNTVAQNAGRQPRWRRAQGPPCPPTGQRCDHDSCAAIRRRIPGPALSLQAAWLSRHVETLRKHPDAGRAFAELRSGCEALTRLVDRPADKELIGVCDCGKILYATDGNAFVTCPMPTCKLRWEVAKSREILRQHLGDKLVTAAEAANLHGYLDPDRSQDTVRKLIASRVSGGQLVAHGDIDGEPVYQFGEIVAVIAAIPRRKRERTAA